MNNFSDFHDISFALEEIRLISRKKITLTKRQLEKIDHLPEDKREETIKKILAKKEKGKKELLDVWATTLEIKARNSGLPPKILSKVLDYANYARNGNVLYNFEQEIVPLKEEIKEEEQKAMNNASTETTKAEEETTQDSVFGSPFVHVRYTKEEFERGLAAYFDHTVLNDLVLSGKKPIVALEPQRVYPQKQGSQYPKATKELEQKHNDEWLDLLVSKVQAKQEETGEKVQPKEIILASFENMPNAKKRYTIQALQNQDPELAQRQREEERIVYEIQLKKNIEKQREQKAIKELAREKRIKREFEKASQDYFRNEILPRFISSGKDLSTPVQIDQIKDLIYSKEDLELAQQHEQELLQCFVKKVQKQQKKAHQQIQASEDILASFSGMSEEHKNCILQTMLSWNPRVIHPQQENSAEQQNGSSTRGLSGKSDVLGVLMSGKKKGKNDPRNACNNSTVLGRLGKAQKTSLPNEETKEGR